MAVNFDSVNCIKFTDLAENCLEEIFQQLEMPEQLALLLLDPVFQGIILRIWRRQYAHFFDFNKQNHIKYIKMDDFASILYIIGNITQQFFNVDCFVWMHFMNFWGITQFPKINGITIIIPYMNRLELPMKISNLFPNLQIMHLRNVSVRQQTFVHLEHLTDLELIYCPTTPDIGNIFDFLPLKRLCILPKATPNSGDETKIFSELNSMQSPISLKGISRCKTLQVLQLAMDLTGDTIEEIVQLPHLRQLTIFTVGEDISLAEFTAQQKKIISVLKLEKRTSIEGFSIKCYMDKRLLPILHYLPSLKSIAWHSHLHVIFANNEIKFQAYDTHFGMSLLRLIESCRSTLKVLDFRRNMRAKHHFMHALKYALGWHPSSGGPAYGDVQIKRDNKDNILDSPKTVRDFQDWLKYDGCGFFEFTFAPI